MAIANNDNYVGLSGATIKGGIVSGSSTPAWVAALPTRRWVNVGTSIQSIDPKDNPAINPNYAAGTRPPWGMSIWSIHGIFAWGGGCLNGSTFYQHGGGHGDSGDNGVYAIDWSQDSPAWRIDRKTAGSIGNWDGVNTLGFDGQDFVSDLYYNGEPRSSHTYNGLCIAEGKMYVIQGYKAGPGGVGGNTLFAYDLTTKTWESKGPLPTLATGMQARDMVFVPSRREIVCIGPGNVRLARYKLQTGTWVSSTQATNTSGGARMVYVPTLDCIVGVSWQLGNVVGPGFFVWDFENTTGTYNIFRPSNVVGTSPTTNYDLKSGVWVSQLGAIVLWFGGADLWTLTPPATGGIGGQWTWGKITADAGNSLVPNNNLAAQDPEVFGRFFYLEQYGVIGLSQKPPAYTDPIQPCFMFKL